MHVRTHECTDVPLSEDMYTSYTCIHVCTYTYVYMYIHTRMYAVRYTICLYAYVCKHKYLHAYMCTCTHIHMLMYIYIYNYIYIYIYTCLHIHISWDNASSSCANPTGLPTECHSSSVHCTVLCYLMAVRHVHAVLYQKGRSRSGFRSGMEYQQYEQAMNVTARRILVSRVGMAYPVVLVAASCCRMVHLAICTRHAEVSHSSAPRLCHVIAS